jgi:uncharacterized protein YbjT (DUF2867 family)
MADPLVLVLGGTGTVGSSIVAQLAKFRVRVRVLSRDPGKARAGQHAEVVRGDLSAPGSLPAAFAGVKRLFLLTPAGPEQVTQEANALTAANHAGVEHVVKLSGGGVILMPHMAHTGGVALAKATEAQLLASKLSWTILRPGAYNTNAMKAFGLLARGGLYLPAGEGKDSHIDPRDIAAVAVKALIEPGHDGKAYDLTGPQLLSYREVVEKISRALGRPLTYNDVPATTWSKEMVAAGAPAPLVESLVAYFGGVRDGLMYATTTVADLLGRARTFDDWVREELASLV